MNVVLWGAGNHALKNILPALKKNEFLKLYGVCSRNKEVLSSISKKYNCKTWSDANEMLKEKLIDIIYLSTPPGLHYKQAMMALNKKKHVLSEKPITTNFNDTKKLIDAFASEGLFILEASMYLFHNHFVKLNEIIKSGYLGNIKEISCEFRLPTLESPGYRNNHSLGASCLYDVGFYPVSLITNLYQRSSIEINKVELFLDEGKRFDIAGKALININNSVISNLSWSYNDAYSNLVKVVGSEKQLSSCKIFSKDEGYSPSIIISGKNKEPEVLTIDAENHFNSMFSFFYKSVHDKIAQKKLYGSMIKTSSMLEEIKNYKPC